MSKSRFFTGQPIFSQLLSFVPKSLINHISRKHQADRYCKHFTTHGHLISMLYAVYNGCTSIREVTTGLLACQEKILHLGLDYFPRRSTLSDANNRRDECVFGEIYESLYARHRHLLPDSRKGKGSNLFIADSSTASLFQEVLRNAGRSPDNGKRKGGIKIHTLMRSDEDVPCLIRFSSGAAHDSPFLKELKLPEGSILIFDRGYNDYSEFQRFSDESVTWVTRKRKNAVTRLEERLSISEAQHKKGIRKDHLVMLGHHHHTNHSFVKARLIGFTDPESGKKFEFLTNNMKLAAASVADLYKKRWQIEILFKRLKQNYPLRYFLGDSENAIKIQIWCVLIADLLLKIVKSLAARAWSFNGLASMIRQHLMTYINLYAFLKNLERAFPIPKLKRSQEGLLFST